MACREPLKMPGPAEVGLTGRNRMRPSPGSGRRAGPPPAASLPSASLPERGFPSLLTSRRLLGPFSRCLKAVRAVPPTISASAKGAPLFCLSRRERSREASRSGRPARAGCAAVRAASTPSCNRRRDAAGGRARPLGASTDPGHVTTPPQGARGGARLTGVARQRRFAGAKRSRTALEPSSRSRRSSPVFGR